VGFVVFGAPSLRAVVLAGSNPQNIRVIDTDWVAWLMKHPHNDLGFVFNSKYHTQSGKRSSDLVCCQSLFSRPTKIVSR
jgi:hypothetical protein